jgi:hypothetical protein
METRDGHNDRRQGSECRHEKHTRCTATATAAAGVETLVLDCRRLRKSFGELTAVQDLSSHIAELVRHRGGPLSILPQIGYWSARPSSC